MGGVGGVVGRMGAVKGVGKWLPLIRFCLSKLPSKLGGRRGASGGAGKRISGCHDSVLTFPSPGLGGRWGGGGRKGRGEKGEMAVMEQPKRRTWELSPQASLPRL